VGVTPHSHLGGGKMIRQPINAFPSLGNAIDGAEGNTFSFTFNGDKLSAYQIFIRDANTNSAVYTGTETNLTLYNGQPFEAVIPSGSFANGRDLIWQAKLIQADTTMNVTRGVIQATGTTSALRISPNRNIRAGMKITITSGALQGITRTVSSYTDYLLLSTSVLGANATYTTAIISTGLSSIIGNTLILGGERRTIVDYNSSTGLVTVLPGFSKINASGSVWIVANERIATLVTTTTFASAPVAGVSYAIVSDFIFTPNYFFKSRTTPVLRMWSMISGITGADSISNTVVIQSGIVSNLPDGTGLNMRLSFPGIAENLTCSTYNSTTGLWTWTSAGALNIPQGTPYVVRGGITTTLVNRIGSFLGNYVQAQGTNVKYHIFNLYDESDSLIDTTGRVFNSLLEYEYDAFASGQNYSIEMITETQDGVIQATPKYSFFVTYRAPDFVYSPTITNLPLETGVEVEWIKDKLAVPTATGSWEIIEDFPFVGTNSVKINTGEIIYDNITNNSLNIDDRDYTIFSDITTPITNDGNLISIEKFGSSGDPGRLGMRIRDFVIYVFQEGSDLYEDFEEEILDGEIPTSPLFTADGIAVPGVGYIWTDDFILNNDDILTLTSESDEIRIKVALLPVDLNNPINSIQAEVVS
jgi:hypothetical protein